MSFQSPKQLIIWIFTFRKNQKLFLVIIAFWVAVFGISTPLLQKVFVDQLTHNSNALFESLLPQWHLSIWLILSGLSLLTSLWLYQGLTYLCTKEASLTNHELSKSLYAHILKLRPVDYENKSSGELIANYATDIQSTTILLEQSLPQGLNILFPLILTPWVLIQFLNVPAFYLLPVFFVFVLINFFLAYRQSGFFYKFKHLAADRIGLVSEWIFNIKALRIFGWLEWTENRIIQARKRETFNRIQMLNNGQTMNALSSTMTFGFTSFILWTLSLDPSKLAPGNVLAVFWLVTVFLNRSFRQLPWFFTFLFDAWTSLERLSSAFTLGHSHIKPPHPQSQSNSHSDSDLHQNTNKFFEPSEDSSEALIKKIACNATPSPSVTIKNLRLTIKDKPILNSINLNLTSGQLIALIGPVGAGKSLLLLSIMGETEAQFDEYQIGSFDLLKIPRNQWKHFFVYIPQDGFLMSSSLRDNLMLEYDTPSNCDPSLSNHLPLVQFETHKEGLPDGLNTRVGERGINLSGGQKQRISLARALFRDTPLALFDDCLSAVDVNTERALIDDFFKDRFQNKILILVTARYALLPRADKVIYLDHGQIKAFGAYQELSQSDTFFISFLEKLKDQDQKQAQQQTLAASTSELI